MSTLGEAETGGPLFRPTALRAFAGRLWVLDAGNHRLVAVDRGQDPTEVGREGEGPGEFLNVKALQSQSDNLTVWDLGLRRLTKFDVRGEVVETTRFFATWPGLEPWVVYRAGTAWIALLNQSRTVSNPPGPDGAAEGYLVRTDAEGVEQDTLAAFPTFGATVVRWRERRRNHMTVYAPFSDAAAHFDHTPACGGVFALSVGGRGLDVRFFDDEGCDIGRWTDPSARGPAVDPDDWEAYLDHWTGDQRRRLAEAVEMPTHHAVLQALRLTTTGFLLTRVTPPGTRATRIRWQVRPLARAAGDRIEPGSPLDVLLPGGFMPYEVRNDTVWGLHYDEWDVPSVQAYTIPGDLGTPCRN